MRIATALTLLVAEAFAAPRPSTSQLKLNFALPPLPVPLLFNGYRKPRSGGEDLESVPYETIRNFEERLYPCAKYACTTSTYENYGANVGLKEGEMFSKLFVYIGGNNNEYQSIEMTTPVITKVSVWDDTDSKVWVTKEMCFYIPENFQGNPPVPNNPDVFIVKKEERVVFVKMFMGYQFDITGSVWINEKDTFMQEMADLGLADEADGNHFYTATYDNPMTGWSRHEVMFDKKSYETTTATAAEDMMSTSGYSPGFGNYQENYEAITGTVSDMMPDSGSFTGDIPFKDLQGFYEDTIVSGMPTKGDCPDGLVDIGGGTCFKLFEGGLTNFGAGYLGTSGSFGTAAPTPGSLGTAASLPSLGSFGTPSLGSLGTPTPSPSPGSLGTPSPSPGSLVSPSPPGSLGTPVSLQTGGSGVGSRDEYCAIAEDHTMCLHQGPSDSCASKTISRELSSDAKQALVDKHNELRRKVAKGEETSNLAWGNQPPASNMRKLVWNDELAVIAQRLADQCIFAHDINRDKLDRTMAGQNLYRKGSSLENSFDELMQTVTNGVVSWYEEVEDPGYNSNDIDPFQDPRGAGHYTQVVWAESEEVGCGFTYYREGIWFRQLVVCNYAVAGNFMYKAMYLQGEACSQCPDGYSCEDGLCAKN